MILIDFYTIKAKSLRETKKWITDNRLLMSLKGINVDQLKIDVKTDATETPIAKAKEAWYLEFSRGIDADVFLESSEAPFIEEVLSHERANEPQIQTMRFRSSYIKNPHVRY